MIEPRRAHARASSLLAAAALSCAAGCIRVETTEMRVKDPSAVGVQTSDNRWLMPPRSGPETTLVLRNFAKSDSLARSADGDISYVSERSLLGARVDTTTLVDRDGNVWGGALPAKFGPLGDTTTLEKQVQRGGAVRLPVSEVRATGPLGTCNGTLNDACVDYPAAPIALATDARNVREVDRVRTPMRIFGIVEIPMGIILTGAGAISGAVGLESSPSASRDTALAIDAGMLALGGALLANGLWYLLAPQERSIVYRAE